MLPDMKFTYGSLFSGVGGFDLGFDRAGFDPVFQVEWDKHCQTILNRHWPDVPKWQDVQEGSGAEVPPCDVLTFGSPCQDLSVAGKQAGLGGGRSSMFFEATRIIKEMQNATGGTFPRVAVWENVPGALSSNKGADFAVVLDEMAECGALVLEWAVLDARWFGVPQRRRRIFLVAIFDPVIAGRCGSEILPVPARGDWNPPSGEASKQGASGAAGSDSAGSSGGSGEGGGSLTLFTQSSYGGYTEGAGTLSATDYKRPEQHVVPIIIDPTREPPRLYDDATNTLTQKMGTGGNNVPLTTILSFDTQFGSNANVFEDESPTLKASQQSPSIMSPIPIQDGREIEKKQNGMGVGNVDDPMYTLDTTGSQSVAYSIREDAKADTFSATETDTALCLNALRPSVQSHHAQLFLAENEGEMHVIRRLLPVECERLMGWPDDWTRWRDDGTEQADTHRYKQCGNGVASPVAQWVAERLLEVMQ